MTLDRAAAEQAIRTHGGRAARARHCVEAASAIIQVANANMADAVRLISIRRGYDPREFALVVFGGAGPLHGAALARELSIPTVLVPPNPGITSALGCLLVDIRHDLSTMFLAHGRRPSTRRTLEREFAALEAEARERLAAEGVPEEQMSLQRSIDMRYLGQWRSMAMPVSAPVDRSRTPIGRVPRRARARAQLPPRRRAGRDLPARPPRGRRDAEARARAARARPARRREPTGARPVRFDEPATPSTRRSTTRDDAAGGRRARGPGRRRAARLDDARAAAA